MRQLLFFIIVIGNCLSVAYGQAVPVNEQARELLRSTPQEKVYVHYNTSLLFAGEYLYYKVYVVNSETGLLSNISKRAYVELVAEDGERIFRHKINLDKGLGGSDYFLPTALESGNYKLLGYTQWMKNGGKQNFFRADIAVVNPYRGDQSAISAEEVVLTEKDSATATSAEKASLHRPDLKETERGRFSLTTDKQEYDKRERVSLSIEFKEKALPHGNFSLSVRKVAGIPLPGRVSAARYAEMYPQAVNGGQGELVYLPELRGNLISGTILPNNPEKPVPVGNKKVAFSIPGEDFALKIATTDENGNFYLNLMEEYPQSEAYLQVVGEEKGAYSIALHPQPGVAVSALDFADFRITPQMKQLILGRSVHNQIENAYYAVKPDTLLTLSEVEPFYSDEPEWYDLDAYTRFKTIKETFIEIIGSSWVTKNRNGEPVIEVADYDGAIQYGLPPLLLVDGVMVQDHGLFIDYPSTRVQRIGILKDNYYLGTHVFQGIVVVETIEGDFLERLNQEYIEKVELEKPQPEKRYFRQVYNDSTRTGTARIPDFRTQLLWEPSLKLNSEEVVVPFYTSDNAGEYEIALEGFTGEGEPVSVKAYFRVE